MNLKQQERSNIPVVASGPGQGVLAGSQGFNVMRLVETCDEGMSPQIDNFNMNFSRLK